jgi:hypothetical protein
MAIRALESYLRYGYDEIEKKYFGRIQIDGTPDRTVKEKPYMPDEYSNVWEFLFPTHDYPIHTAMTILDCLEKGDFYVQAAKRWADVTLQACSPCSSREVRYAEQYGRNIVFLAEYARISGESVYHSAAEQLANEAVVTLFKQNMFVGHTGADWYDAVDGVGFLLLALLYMETGNIEIATNYF